MGYLHINNLYRDQNILMFRKCYALEKIHGTSAHVRYEHGQVSLSSGGESATRFARLFDVESLKLSFEALGHPKVVVYGEAYGGSQQKQAWRYGAELRFVAFDVKIGDLWLSVPAAYAVATTLGFDFVHYDLTSTDLEALDALRDAPSTQAQRNGVPGDQPREGVVLRPIVELTLNNGERIIVKHKRDEERETKTPRTVVDPSQLQRLTDAAAIAEEWVTPTRLAHVLDKLPKGIGIEKMGHVIHAMIEDVLREGSLEITNSREAQKAIGARAAQLFKNYLKDSVQEGATPE